MTGANGSTQDTTSKSPKEAFEQARTSDAHHVIQPDTETAAQEAGERAERDMPAIEAPEEPDVATDAEVETRDSAPAALAVEENGPGKEAAATPDVENAPAEQAVSPHALAPDAAPAHAPVAETKAEAAPTVEEDDAGKFKALPDAGRKKEDTPPSEAAPEIENAAAAQEVEPAEQTASSHAEDADAGPADAPVVETKAEAAPAVEQDGAALKIGAEEVKKEGLSKSIGVSNGNYLPQKN
jgi:hypothetical protein